MLEGGISISGDPSSHSSHPKMRPLHTFASLSTSVSSTFLSPKYSRKGFASWAILWENMQASLGPLCLLQCKFCLHNNQLYFITWHHNTQQLTYVEIHRGSSYMGMFNLREPQKSANDATLKTVKKYKIFWDFQCSASLRSPGLAEIQTGTWGRWGGSALDANWPALNTPLFHPRCCFEVAEVEAGKGWVITEQTDVCWPPPHGLPKRICGLGTKK